MAARPGDHRVRGADLRIPRADPPPLAVAVGRRRGRDRGGRVRFAAAREAAAPVARAATLADDAFGLDPVRARGVRQDPRAEGPHRAVRDRDRHLWDAARRTRARAGADAHAARARGAVRRGRTRRRHREGARDRQRGRRRVQPHDDDRGRRDGADRAVAVAAADLSGRRARTGGRPPASPPSPACRRPPRGGPSSFSRRSPTLPAPNRAGAIPQPADNLLR
ncbi:conserved hypothetical protein [Burkholderia vietnamiensis]|nr:conserved hypothetical protein [Burkholderia vietnamiensis]